MLSFKEKIFLKKDERFLIQILAENNIFLIFAIDKNEIEKGNNFLAYLKKEVSNNPLSCLSDWQGLIDQGLKLARLLPFWLTGGVLVKDKTFFLITRGQGKIILIRDKKISEIIVGNHTAAGYVKDGDIFIFSYSSFPTQLTFESLTDIFFKNSFDEGTKIIKADFYDQKKEETALFINFFSKKEPTFSFPRFSFSLPHLPSFSFFQASYLRGKKLTWVILSILGLIFLWSVVFGYKRRLITKRKAMVNFARTEIEKKLEEAVDLSTFDLNESLKIINEVKQTFSQLKKDLGKEEKKEIEKIEKIINSKEKEILKKEEKEAEEFFDLKLIKKEAKGNKMALFNDTLAVFNQKEGEVYLISIDKKSHQILTSPSIKNGDLIALYENDVFIFTKEKGIIKLKNEKEEKRVVEKDDSWGKIIDFWVYNGNLYLLDKEKDEVYKYLVAVEGYGGKTSYFKPQEAIDLSLAVSMAIDSSVYIATEKNVFKYTSGIREKFSLNFPNQEKFFIHKIYTDRNCQKIYLWVKNKEESLILVFSKTGQYERQIRNQIFKKVEDLVVFEKKGILLLTKEKIYQLPL